MTFFNRGIFVSISNIVFSAVSKSKQHFPNALRLKSVGFSVIYCQGWQQTHSSPTAQDSPWGQASLRLWVTHICPSIFSFPGHDGEETGPTVYLRRPQRWKKWIDTCLFLSSSPFTSVQPAGSEGEHPASSSICGNTKQIPNPQPSP